MIKQIIIILLINAMTSCSDQATLQPLDSNATILAFGDSLTYGTGSSINNAYPAALETLIHRKVINAGVPGEISQKGLSRLPQLISQYRPDLIIICHGGNDILHKLDMKQTKQNIQRMIDLARQSNIQVLLIGVPEFGLFLKSSPIYQTLAEENHIPIENNILGDILGNNSLKSDHIHPNSHGYRLFAEQIASLLRQSGAI
jgi:lysophospholipase L1-like esterase